MQNARQADYSDDMDEELAMATTTLPKKQTGATKSIMRPSRKTAEEKSRAKMLESSQNNGICFTIRVGKIFGSLNLLSRLLNSITTRW